MRVAVYHNLPFGGARRVMQRQVAGLAECDPQVFAPDRSLRLIGLLPCPFGRLNGLLNLVNMRIIDRENRRLARDIDTSGFDVVLVHPCRVTQTPSVLRYLRTPTVYYCHEPFRPMHEAKIVGGPFADCRDPMRCLYTWAAIKNEYLSLKAANVVLTNSRYTRETVLIYYGIESTVQYPGVDTDAFHPDPDVERRRAVLCIGRLSKMKNHDFAIRCVGSIPAALRPRLEIVYGGGNLEAEASLGSLADECGVDLAIHADISDQKLVDLYCGVKVVFACAVLEPLGLSPLESMACGTPVVGVAEAGIRETIVDGVTGFLTRRDPEEFSGAVLRLLQDAALAENMGRAGREHVVANWNWQKSIVELKAVLNQVANQN